MGTVGVQEMIVIFLVALVLFGPKKLPELGRTIGKAITEFRRASNDLKATFEREMQSLERETESLKETTAFVDNEIRSASLDYSMYELPPYAEPADSTATNPSSTTTDLATVNAMVSGSEASGAESHETAGAASHEHAVVVTPAEGIVARTEVSHADGTAKPAAPESTPGETTPGEHIPGENGPAVDTHQHQLT